MALDHQLQRIALTAPGILFAQLLLSACLGLATAAASAAESLDAEVASARDSALSGDTFAWDVIEGLTTEIGPRLAATEREAQARDWAMARLKRLGFQNVRMEPFDMPLWIRGEAHAEIISPFPQELVIAALGNSSATPAGGLEAEVVAFDGLAALNSAPDAAVRGKIAFITHHMTAQQDGGAYRNAGPIRFNGPALAAKKGAVAILIRSVGTDHHRIAHTGVTAWTADVQSIPAAALSTPDADQLLRILSRGRPVTVHLTLQSHFGGTARSGNVVAEIPGSDPAAGIVLIGGHLDSWDQGTGAIDDAAGLGIVTAAAKRVMDAGTPLRTLRVVWFGAEEPGGFGGKAYAQAHLSEHHVLVAESDLGADRVWTFAVTTDRLSTQLVERLAIALEPLGITRSNAPAQGGEDMKPIADTGVSVVDLVQDATRYFDVHHTPDDTLDKIDPVQLRQNVAAWTAMLTLMANVPGPLAPSPTIVKKRK